MTIYDSIGCSKDIRAAKVTVPFSIGVTGLAPNSSTEIFMTDKDAKPDVVYGPGIFTADENGNICLDIFDAPAGTWKIDVVEQGSGFTDSKVFTVEETANSPDHLAVDHNDHDGHYDPTGEHHDDHDGAADDTGEHDHYYDQDAGDHLDHSGDHHDVGAADHTEPPPPRRWRLRPPAVHRHDHVGATTTPSHHHHGRTDNVARVDNVASDHYTDDSPHHAAGHRAGVGDATIR